MPKWAKIALRTVGVINFATLLLGTSLLLDKVYRVLAGHITEPSDAPYFRLAFAVMALVEAAFVGVFLTTAIRFIRAKLSAANLYSLAVLLHIVYSAATGMLWLARRGIGTSIAAASSVSGVAPFEFLFLVPFLYPALSVVLVQLLKQRYNARQIPVNA